jgi:hypothetical protein
MNNTYKIHTVDDAIKFLNFAKKMYGGKAPVKMFNGGEGCYHLNGMIEDGIVQLNEDGLFIDSEGFEHESNIPLNNFVWKNISSSNNIIYAESDISGGFAKVKIHHFKDHDLYNIVLENKEESKYVFPSLENENFKYILDGFFDYITSYKKESDSSLFFSILQTDKVNIFLDLIDNMNLVPKE